MHHRRSEPFPGFAAPHLFGDHGPVFEAELRELLTEVSPEGQFSEQMRETAIDLWRV